MNCNPDAAADGTTPAAAPPSPAHPSAPMDSLPIPRCNTNCRLPGCAANPNLCPQCSAHLPADDDSRPAAAHGLDPLTHVVSVAGGMPLDRRLSHRCDPPPAPCHEQSGEITTAEPTFGAGAAAGTVRSSCPTPKIVGGAAPGLRPSDECDGRDKAKPVSPRSFSPSDSSTSPAPAGEQKAKRCAACGKRVGPRGFKCRCGDLFCAMHRYSEKHDCSFDYKAAGRLAIAKENPLVIARKIIQL